LIDIRYHIYSLVAVFLALSVGIVIGTSFTRSSPSADTSRRTVQRYESDMRNLKAEIETAAEEAADKHAVAEECQAFCRAVMPVVVKNRLSWRNVAIIQTGDDNDLLGSVRQALGQGGATVTSVTKLSRDFPFTDTARIALALQDAGVTPGEDGIESRDKLFAVIADTIYSAKYSELLPKLEEAGIGEFTGDFQRFNKSVVIVGGADSEETNTADDIDTKLIAQLEKVGVTVVGCESFDTASSYVSSWHRSGIATVDNADTPMGQIALVCAVGGEVAKFGAKETADRLIPQALEPK